MMCFNKCGLTERKYVEVEVKSLKEELNIMGIKHQTTNCV